MARHVCIVEFKTVYDRLVKFTEEMFELPHEDAEGSFSVISSDGTSHVFTTSGELGSNKGALNLATYRYGKPILLTVPFPHFTVAGRALDILHDIAKGKWAESQIAEFSAMARLAASHGE